MTTDATLRDPLDIAESWFAEGRSVAIATVIETWGSALDVIKAGTAKMLEFGVADETAWRVGLSCGGRIRVQVERLG